MVTFSWEKAKESFDFFTIPGKTNSNEGGFHMFFSVEYETVALQLIFCLHTKIHKEGLILFTWPSDDNVFFYFFGHGVVWLLSQGSPQINKGDFINANNRGVCFLEYGFAVFQNGLSPQYLETNRSTYPIYFILFLAVNICGDELSHLTYQMILDEVRDYYSLSFFFAFLF